MKHFIFSSLFLMTFFCSMTAQEEIKLYKNGPKESNGITDAEAINKSNFVTNITDARMYAYVVPKEKATGAAVVICPGGGYSGISVEKEGFTIAKWFNQLGISAFVLYYRMPNGHYEIPLKDAQTAFQIIHDNAKKWNINKNKIGVMGFSAGGHLASTVGTHFNSTINRPSFMILCYPVITMNRETTHLGSRTNL
jgi:acetyl esterase/lipase